MPLIRCPKCGQAYDIPGVVSVRLQSAIATCHCGEWLSGSKAAVLARLMDADQIKEIDLSPYRVDANGAAVAPAEPEPAAAPFSPAPFIADIPDEPEPATRVLLVCVEGPLMGQEFEIPPTGLVVGREGHVRVPDEFLSRKHFEVRRDPSGAVRVRDLGSRNGTTLNSQPANDSLVGAGDLIEAGLNRFRIEERA